MARRKRTLVTLTEPTPIIINGHVVPLTPFYLYFRKALLEYGHKLNDDQIDEILQLEASEVSDTADPSRYYFFGLCGDIYTEWNYFEEDEVRKYHDQYETVLHRFFERNKVVRAQCEEIQLSGKCGLKLNFDEFSHVCEFLDGSSMVNLAVTCKQFDFHYEKLIITLLSSNQFVEYFKRKRIEPRLSLLLSEKLSPELKQFKDSLDIKMIIDFKVLERQPGGNYDDFIIRQVVQLNSKETSIFKSKIRNYDGWIYDDDIIISIEKDPIILRDFIHSICKMISNTEPSLPLIFKPQLTHQYICTSKDDASEPDDPTDFSQVEISIYNKSEKFFDFVKVSTNNGSLNVLPFKNSKSISNLIENTNRFCKVVSLSEAADQYIDRNEPNLFRAKKKPLHKCRGLSNNSNFAEDEDEEDEEEEDEEDDKKIDLEKANEAMWNRFFKQLA
ncbi:predicted protein [Naegleria gruberi]|uniref:Predicted protein n=1 Tax=Naegleria gruberi TaxID=5762 RepID=D2VI57_NAEGR|nr:uncharacterized protein NAEGRDRAFT_68570 [Naegleria gruberi]EFC43533.1 predicted protein [Naegleria gruberi]|eukprot:XP_002676277.1 predicted protein [Naegleria gruberi strain NEG-M]